MNDTSQLAGAAESAKKALDLAHVAVEKIADTAMVLQVWSDQRTGKPVTTFQQQELRRYFREAHKLLAQSEQQFEAAIREQAEQRIVDGGTNGAAHAGARGARFRRRRSAASTAERE
ncbi:MAG: hypothetical protein KJZ93_26320 [Caldilineaceae bacterium]|nr:hypothetical protein [Caldilineaceae bacterium]